MAGPGGFHGDSFPGSRDRFKHQVFLSFRGEDVRKTFVGHLYNALKAVGIKVFRDNDGLEHGNDIQCKLYEAIERSQLSVVILSQRYADSRWCLDELVKIMECRDLLGHAALPVFYDVEPTEVRNQSGLYEKPFRTLEDSFRNEVGKAEKWKGALEQVASLRGMSLKEFNGDEAILVENIIQQVRQMADTRQFYVPTNIVGRDSILRELDMWLQDGSQDIEVGLIYGLGGIGKTIIAQISYNNNAHRFDGCSFLAEFNRKSSQGDGLQSLLEQLIFDVSGKTGNKIYDLRKGMMDVRAVVLCKRLLLVLDDVDELEQVYLMLENHEWFHPGSKIIITTRNQDLRQVSMVKREFSIQPLCRDESLKLFCQHAFGQNIPLENYGISSERFIRYCGGVPLAIEVLALSLRGRKLEVWECQLAKLADYPNKKILDVLKLSFESLEDENDKNIFLHVAFFLVGKNSDYAIRILEGCDLHPKVGLQNLISRCLLTLGAFGELHMHQLVQQMGREVVRQEASNEPGRRSRLWSNKDTYNVLRNSKGTSLVKGLSLNFPASISLSEGYYTEQALKRARLTFLLPKSTRHLTRHSRFVRTEGFRGMSSLDLLELNYLQLEGGYEDFPKTIKWLWWQGCPLEFIPTDLNLYELVVLDMRNSNLVHAWEGVKVLGALRVLNLSHSHQLVDTPDFSSASQLEWIILEGCINLVTIHETIGNLQHLTYLNLKGCRSLQTLPMGLGKIPALESLDLSGCSSLFVLPDETKSSVIITSDKKTIPKTTVNSNEASLLHIQISTSPYSSSSFFPTLVKLNLEDCGICHDAIFDKLCGLSSLKELNLSGNPLRQINKNLDHLSRLDKLLLNGCDNLKSVSALPMKCKVSVDRCSSLETISYIKNSELDHGYLSADLCPKLIEFGSLCKLEVTCYMDAAKAKYMGYPKLESLSYRILHFVDEAEDLNYLYFRGLYKDGVYCASLPGDHLSNWFAMIFQEEEIHYCVPNFPNRPIRAINVCCVAEDIAFWGVNSFIFTMENLTRKWEWHYEPGNFSDYHDSNCTYLSGYCIRRTNSKEMMWLTHWCVMEHREMRPGDELIIRAHNSMKHFKVKCGIKILYEDEERLMNEEGSAVADWYKNTFHRNANLSKYLVDQYGKQSRKRRRDIYVDKEVCEMQEKGKPTGVRVYQMRNPNFWLDIGSVWSFQFHGMWMSQ